MNVFEAANDRIAFIFNEFENIYVSLSGGKDSGVLINLVIDIARKKNRKFTLLFIDLEGVYKKTHDFIIDVINNNLDVLIPIWVCLPMKSPNGVSMYEPFWTFWDNLKKEKWIREMPDYDFVLNDKNNPFLDTFWHSNITFEEFIDVFGDWFSDKNGGGKAACLVGIRTQESLNRWRAINREDVSRYKNKKFSVKKTEKTFNFYPIFDWSVEDIWIYNGKFNKPYNKIYDSFYLAGLPLSQMRVCEPYGNEQKAGLNLFKIIEPETWVRVVDRVSGANFGNIYSKSKMLGVVASLPEGHTWKSYTKFLLKTLPEKTRKNYVDRFVKFIKWWRRKGSPVPQKILDLIPNNLIENKGVGATNRGKKDKPVIVFKKTLDHIGILESKSDFPTWKRMALCILKNDIMCKSLHFGLSKKDIERRDYILNKYKGL